MTNDELRTERLVLRRWRPEDEDAMAAINRDPEVAEFLNRAVDEEAVRGFHGLMVGHWEAHGFGPYAVESAGPEGSGTFLGFVGFAYLPPFLAAAGEGPELGWRLGRAAWGRGLATEAARGALDAGRAERPCREVISVIHPRNVRSQRVAIKLGMHRARQVPNPLLNLDTDVWVLPGPHG